MIEPPVQGSSFTEKALARLAQLRQGLAGAAAALQVAARRTRVAARDAGATAQREGGPASGRLRAALAATWRRGRRGALALARLLGTAFGLIGRLLARAGGRKRSRRPPPPADSGAAAYAGAPEHEPMVAAAADERVVSPEVILPGVEPFRTIQIERHDDIASIRSKLHGAPGRTVVARVDRRNASLRSQLGVRLLRRHVDATRLHLVLQTRNGRIRQLARNEGLLVVGTMRGREIKHGRLMPRYLRLGFLALPLPSFGIVFRLTTLATLLVVGLIAAAALGPSATVRLAPELMAVSVPLAVEARVVAEGDLPEDGVLPAERVELQLSATDAIVTTGRISVSGAPATGTLRIENRTALPLEVPQGSDVGAIGGARFRTTEAVTVPAGAGSVALARIEAEQAGPEGNVPAGTVVLPGSSLAGRVDVSNPAPTTGGDDTRVQGASSLDVDRVRRTSERILRVRGLQALEQATEGRFTFHPDTLQVEVLSEAFLPELDQPSDVLEVTTIAVVSVIGVSLEEIRELAAREIRTLHGSGFQVVMASLEPMEIGDALFDEALDAISFDMMMEGHVASTIIPEAVERAVRLERVSAAEAMLNLTLRLREPARIDLTPGFMPFVSPFGFRIKVEVLDTLPPDPDEESGEDSEEDSEEDSDADSDADLDTDADADLDTDADADADGDADGDAATDGLPAGEDDSLDSPLEEATG